MYNAASLMWATGIYLHATLYDDFYARDIARRYHILIDLKNIAHNVYYYVNISNTEIHY